MAMDSLNVAVIGAGVGGLTLAKTLLKSHVRVTVYEAWDEWKTRGGSLGLSTGRRVLAALGLEEALAKVANDMNDMQAFEMNYHAEGQVVNSKKLPGCFVMRRDLQKLLVDSLPAGTVKLGHKLADIVEGEDEVMLSFENGATASADLVVAADGIHSFVRQKIFAGDRPVYTGFRILYSVCSKPIRPDTGVGNIHWYQVDGSGYGVIDVTAGRDETRQDQIMMILRSEEGSNEKWDSTIVKDRLAAVVQKVAPQHQVLHEAVEHAEVCFDWGIYRQPFCETWISPKSRVVLLGDAAHATAPFLGQGANMAMHDGYCLGQILLNEKLSLPEGLRLFESTRKPYCETVVESSSRMGELHTATGWKAYLRNNFLLFVLQNSMVRMRATDPTEKPWEKSASPLLCLGEGLRRLCAPK